MVKSGLVQVIHLNQANFSIGGKILVFILAGGKSTRMKDANKPHMKFTADNTLLGFILENLISYFSSKKIKLVVKDKNDFVDYKAKYNIAIIEDLLDAGPLGGIYTGLKASNKLKNFFMGCDMPFLQPRLIAWMIAKCQRDILIPKDKGYLEPLAAVYHRNCLSAIETALNHGSRKIIDFFPDVEIDYLDKKELIKVMDFKYLFFNVNNRKDFNIAVNKILPRYLKKISSN